MSETCRPAWDWTSFRLAAQEFWRNIFNVNIA
ncbi:hypothetical protein HCH_05517 [Hahella chejuensis KCTC 2396]|uniref:Uncharacterized protein n=1 Tax=Hahella chejuensis (strain KCTC 2396) TaxID=349521 RepID=Q2SAZ5_HAHCH|nr:hypothetical protein HCH_05517 [Hahella chejuensis KCTC 2396]